MASAVTANPQTLNRYSYVTNSPLSLIDPTGLSATCSGSDHPGPCNEQAQRNEQKPVAPAQIPIDVGDPPPPLVSSISVIAPPPAELTNERGSDGTFFTGVASVLRITPQDAAGNPITGILVAESVFSGSGSNIRQRETPAEVGPDGSFTDLVGVGMNPPPTSPLPPQDARSVLSRVAQRPTDQETVQVLNFYAREGYLIGTAVYTRRFTNLDANGNVRPHTNPNTGRPMVNYSINIGRPRVIRPQ